MDDQHTDALATKPARLFDGGRISATTVKVASISHHDPEDICVICLEKLSEPAYAQPCNHSSFDYLCLLTWLQQTPSCPLCKATTTTVHYDLSAEDGQHKTYTIPAPAPPTTSTSSNELYTNHYNTSRNRRRIRFAPRPPHARPLTTLDNPLARRRHIYRHQLYSLHVGSNRISRFRELTPALFVNDPEIISRARNWMRRELQVFQYLTPDGADTRGLDRRANNAEFLLEYIVAILKTVDMQEAGGKAEELVGEYLGRDDARLFLHELRAWLRSPYSKLEDWDRWVQYRDISVTEREKDGVCGTSAMGRQMPRLRRDGEAGNMERLESMVAEGRAGRPDQNVDNRRASNEHMGRAQSRHRENRVPELCRYDR